MKLASMIATQMKRFPLLDLLLQACPNHQERFRRLHSNSIPLTFPNKVYYGCRPQLVAIMTEMSEITPTHS